MFCSHFFRVATATSSRASQDISSRASQDATACRNSCPLHSATAASCMPQLRPITTALITSATTCSSPLSLGEQPQPRESGEPPSPTTYGCYLRHCGHYSFIGLATLAPHRNIYAFRHERKGHMHSQRPLRSPPGVSAPTQRTLQAYLPHVADTFVHPTRLSTN